MFCYESFDGWGWKDFFGAQHLLCDSDYSSWYWKCPLMGQSILLVFFTKLRFTVFLARCLFLLSHFLVVEAEDYQLPKSTSHILSVPLNLDCVKILSDPSLFLLQLSPWLCLCQIAIWADDTALHSWRDKPSDLSQQVEIASEL